MFNALQNAIHRLIHTEPRVAFSVRFQELKALLERNNRIMELMADMEDKLSGEYIFDRQYILSACEKISDLTIKQIAELSALRRAVRRGVDDDALFQVFDRTQRAISDEIQGTRPGRGERLIVPLEEASQDLREEIGAKNAYLGQIRNVLGLDVPTGFAVTFQGYRDFLEENGLLELRREVEQALQKGAKNKGDEAALADEAAKRMARAILQGRVPKPLAKAIRRAAAGIVEAARYTNPNASPGFAVRSSGWGEDCSAHSFAGQNQTVLNTPLDGLLEAYKQVLAGSYTRRCLLYRKHRGFGEQDAAMAVGIQVMVDARASGVLYTLDPTRSLCSTATDQGQMLVSAIRGCAAPLTDGQISADHFRLERTPPFQVLEQRIAEKTQRLALLPTGGVAFEELAPDLRDTPSLEPAQLAALADAALRLERYDKRPQDMEWAFDRQGRLIILQARPLAVESLSAPACEAIEQAARRAEAIFTGQGLVAQRGVATGKVFVLDDLERLEETPDGAILVTRFTSPRLSRVMHKVHGVVTEVGSPTGHLGTIAREFHVPTLVNVGRAATLLRPGEEVTLDTEHSAVYRGVIEELRLFELVEENAFEDSNEYRLLHRVLRHISPLRLLDPHDQALKPSGRYTIHDICRHVHETAVASLVELSERSRNGCPPLRHVETSLPLGLFALDLGGGAAARAVSKGLSEADNRCLPLRALLDGMNRPEMWPTEPVSVGLGSFLSSFTRTPSSSLATPERVGRNLAVISRDYLYLTLRLGYHFTMVEAHICDKAEDNFIYFRFLGGVTHVDRRSRRARFVAAVLDRFDFRTETHGDLAVGRFKKWPGPRMEEQLRLLGRLIGYTRQLDALLHDDAQIDHYIADFLRRMDEPLEAPNARQS